MLQQVRDAYLDACQRFNVQPHKSVLKQLTPSESAVPNQPVSSRRSVLDTRVLSLRNLTLGDAAAAAIGTLIEQCYLGSTTDKVLIRTLDLDGCVVEHVGAKHLLRAAAANRDILMVDMAGWTPGVKTLKSVLQLLEASPLVYVELDLDDARGECADAIRALLAARLDDGFSSSGSSDHGGDAVDRSPSKTATVAVEGASVVQDRRATGHKAQTSNAPTVDREAFHFVSEDPAPASVVSEEEMLSIRIAQQMARLSANVREVNLREAKQRSVSLVASADTFAANLFAEFCEGHVRLRAMMMREVPPLRATCAGRRLWAASAVVNSNRDQSQSRDGRQSCNAASIDDASGGEHDDDDEIRALRRQVVLLHDSIAARGAATEAFVFEHPEGRGPVFTYRPRVAETLRTVAEHFCVPLPSLLRCNIPLCEAFIERATEGRDELHEILRMVVDRGFRGTEDSDSSSGSDVGDDDDNKTASAAGARRREPRSAIRSRFERDRELDIARIFGRFVVGDSSKDYTLYIPHRWESAVRDRIAAETAQEERVAALERTHEANAGGAAVDTDIATRLAAARVELGRRRRAREMAQQALQEHFQRIYNRRTTGRLRQLREQQALFDEACEVFANVAAMHEDALASAKDVERLEWAVLMGLDTAARVEEEELERLRVELDEHMYHCQHERRNPPLAPPVTEGSDSCSWRFPRLRQSWKPHRRA